MADIVDRAKQALEGVSPGPWGWGQGSLSVRRSMSGPDEEILRCAALLYPDRANMHFIAVTRTLVPDLIAEIDRLRGQVARVRALADDLKPTRREPCENPEPCCGSAASCDALHPSVRVVGRESILGALDGTSLNGTALP